MVIHSLVAWQIKSYITDIQHISSNNRREGKTSWTSSDLWPLCAVTATAGPAADHCTGQTVQLFLVSDLQRIAVSHPCSVAVQHSHECAPMTFVSSCQDTAYTCHSILFPFRIFCDMGLILFPLEDILHYRKQKTSNWIRSGILESMNSTLYQKIPTLEFWK